MEYKSNNCKDWKAIHNFQPVQPPRLRVTGKCTFPTTGYKVELKKHVPQGINPTILLLDKIVIPPTGPAGDVVTTIDVKYEEQTSAHYVEVEILPDGTRIKVEEVH